MTPQSWRRLPDGATTQFRYDGAGRLIEWIDPRGSTTRYTYDAADQVTRVVDGHGASRQFVYDAVGNPIEETDALGRTSRFQYDSVGRLVEVTPPDGTTIRFAYDALGRRTSEVDPNGQETGLTYDEAGRLLEVTDALAGVTHYSYDELGNRVMQTDVRGNSTRFEYDRLGRLIRRALPGGVSETIGYDAEGRVVLHVDMAGFATSFAYDSADRLVERMYSDGSADRFTYTTTGQVATVSDARGVTRYQYDARDRPVSIEFPGGWTLVHVWDLGGNLLSTSASRGAESLTSSYSYDALGRMIEVTDSQAQTFRYTYDAAGRRTTLEYPNGVMSTYTYDGVGRLVDLRTASSDDTELQSFTYTLDPAGNSLSVLEREQTLRMYAYDALYRLVLERVENQDGSLQYQNVFTYDAIGNRLSQERSDQDGNVRSISYSYDMRDRLIEETYPEGSITHIWDMNGNLLSSDWLDADGQPERARQYEWGWGNRLSKAILDDGTQISYSYDGGGTLWRRSTLPPAGEVAEVRYLLDRSGDFSRVLADFDSVGNLSVHYLRGAGGDALAVRLFDDGSELTFHGDGLGSTRTVSTSTGLIAVNYDFEAFGSLLDTSAPVVNRFLYTGEPLDQRTDLYYLRARWMDPRTGRFLSMDPRQGETRAPLTLHRYLYAGAQPVNNVDPSGEFFISLNIGLMILPQLSLFFSTSGLAEFFVRYYPPLPEAKAKALRQATDQIVDLQPQEKCTNKVVRRLAPLGFALSDFQNYLKQGAFYIDGTRSEARPEGILYPNEPSARMWLHSFELAPNAKISDAFAAVGTRMVNAVTSITQKQFTAFFRPDAIGVDDLKRNSGLIFHEGLHGWSSTFGSVWGDTPLKSALRLPASAASVIITIHVSNKCF